MLAELIPECPRLHHGIMAIDPDAEYGIEFVCRLCGTRIYPNEPELIPDVQPLADRTGITPRAPGVCVKCGCPSDTHILCRTCRRKDR